LQEEKGSLSAQNSFYTYALKKVEKKEVTVEVQDIARTKVLLFRDISQKKILTIIFQKNFVSNWELMPLSPVIL